MRARTIKNDDILLKLAIELRKQGLNIAEISNKLHTKHTIISKLLKENGYWISKTNNKSNVEEIYKKCGLLLDDTYINSDTPCKCICIQCGTIHYVSYHNLLSSLNRNSSYQYRCSKCAKILNDEKKQIKKARIILIKKLKKILKAKQKQMEKEPKIFICLNCGEQFLSSKKKLYCSTICCEKYHNRKKIIKRDGRIKNNGQVDNNITLEKLFKRDKGICYLCKGKTDYEDYTYNGNTFIAGNYYPSIDHIIPIAKGGKHEWSNVKLAHRICNSKKSDIIK